MSTTTEDRPVALIVEDVPTTLDTRKENFTYGGFLAIGVRSKAEALRELRSAPAIDIVVTDIGLNPDQPDKDSGIDLLYEVKSLRKDLPVMAYSARDLDDEQLAHAPFDDFLPKGEAWRLDEKIVEWRERALRYRDTRITTARRQLERIQEEYKIPNSKIQILRDFLPGSHLPPADPDRTQETADELLRQAGYRLGMIDAQTSVPESGAPAVKVAVPIVVWLRTVEGAVVAELHGHPAIYGEGELGKPEPAPVLQQDDLQRLKRAEQEAINQVLELMYGYYLDFGKAAEVPAGEPEEVKALREFLKKVFG